MFFIPRKSKSSSSFTSRKYESGNIIYDGTKNTSEIERKYAPYVKQLNDLVRELNTEIATSKRKAKELADMNTKKAVEIEMESAKNRATLYTAKLNAIKTMSGLIKEVKELEMKEQKLIKEITGKVVDIKGGGPATQKAFMASAMELQPSDVSRSIHNLPSYELPKDDSDEATIEVIEEKKVTPVQPIDNIVKGEQPSTNPNSEKFASLFEKPVNPDTPNFISGNNHVDTYDKINGRLSFGVAETGLQNKYMMQTEKKCHYDEELGIGWIRTYDTATKTFASPESFISPEYHGVFHVMQSGGTKYAIDDVDNNYDLVPDKFENAPDEIKEELLRVNSRSRNKEDMGE